MTYYEDYLEHHGVKGMKWGVRRYQNSDGTWTSEGKRRRRSGIAAGRYNIEKLGRTLKRKTSEIKRNMDKRSEQKRVERDERAKVKEEEKKAKAEAKEIADKERINTEIDKAVAAGDVKTILKYRERMSDDDLNRAYNRAKKIDDIAKLAPVEKTRLDKLKGMADTSQQLKNLVTNLIDMEQKIGSLGKKDNGGGTKQRNRTDNNQSQQSSQRNDSNENRRSFMDRLNEIVERNHRNVRTRQENDAFIDRLSGVADQYERERSNSSNDDHQSSYDYFRSLRSNNTSVSETSGAWEANESYIRHLASVADQYERERNGS